MVCQVVSKVFFLTRCVALTLHPRFLAIFECLIPLGKQPPCFLSTKAWLSAFVLLCCLGFVNADEVLYRDLWLPLWLPTRRRNEKRVRENSLTLCFSWSQESELNRRPTDYESVALPTELSWRNGRRFLYQGEGRGQGKRAGSLISVPGAVSVAWKGLQVPDRLLPAELKAAGVGIDGWSSLRA